MKRVLIIGGCGRIGRHITKDLLTYTDAKIAITGRQSSRCTVAIEQSRENVQFHTLDLANQHRLNDLVAQADLVIHAAGPFHYRDASVLQTCIQQRVNYVDVSDERSFTRKALSLNASASAAGITAIINAGVFPGISNSMARKGVESLDHADSVQLSYVVAGSGGAGVTVMRTTFIGLQQPFEAWINDTWQPIAPYTDRERLTFPSPYGQTNVYWYDVPETITLPETFPLKSVVTKFGVVPDFYNQATWMMAHWLPPVLLRSPYTVEFLAQVSHLMTNISDRFSGTGIAIRCDVRGQNSGQAARYVSSFTHGEAAAATGAGVGSIAERLLAGRLEQPGVNPVERALSTQLFMEALASRHLQIQEEITPGQTATL